MVFCLTDIDFFRTKQNALHGNAGRFSDGSLTMTYFHTGIRTIIGAKSFHCPVRDGKEWYQLAMVVRQNFCSIDWVNRGNL